MHIGILTSGGDAPGMNACIRAVVRMARHRGIDVTGIKRGYAGLINGEFLKLGDAMVSGMIGRGGTFLLTARSREFMTEEGRMRALNALERAGIEALVVVGGDGSLRGARELKRLGLPVIGIPATIDNDIRGTDYCIGFDTAVNTVVHAANKIRDTATSHERVFVVEVMGRKRGLLTLTCGLAVGAEAVVLPEIDFQLEEICDTVRLGFQRGKLHNIILIAEGIKKARSGQDIVHSSAYWLGQTIEETTGYETRIIVLGHIQRGGSPTAQDRIIASRMGAHAVDRLDEGESGFTIGLRNNTLVELSFEQVLECDGELEGRLYELVGILG